jgi:nicotinamidase-related amidase
VTRDCLLAVDLFTTFDFPGGDQLLASLRARAEGFRRTLAGARGRAIPIVYANDSFGVWDGNAEALVQRALAGPGGDTLCALRPEPGDSFLLKPRYSAFDLTPLPLVLEELEIERILLVGTATEMCVAQTAIDARERSYKVTVITGSCASGDPAMERTALEYLEKVTGSFLAATLEDALAS